jgi:hypothetical protein
MSSSQRRFCLVRIKPSHYDDDGAITPVTDNETETREMFQTQETRNYVVKIQRVEKMRRVNTRIV